MRDKVLILLAMALWVWLTGCTAKEEHRLMEVYAKKKCYHKQLQKTEKIQLYDGDVTKAALTATYLNKQTIRKKERPDEVFLVSFYVEEEEAVLFGEGDYNLTLNKKSPKEILELKVEDSLLKDISFASEWNRFYRVTFPYTGSTRLNLLFESEHYGKGVLHFAKVAKYVLTKKTF